MSSHQGCEVDLASTLSHLKGSLHEGQDFIVGANLIRCTSLRYASLVFRHDHGHNEKLEVASYCSNLCLVSGDCVSLQMCQHTQNLHSSIWNDLCRIRNSLDTAVISCTSATQHLTIPSKVFIHPTTLFSFIPPVPAPSSSQKLCTATSTSIFHTPQSMRETTQAIVDSPPPNKPLAGDLHLSCPSIKNGSVLSSTRPDIDNALCEAIKHVHTHGLSYPAPRGSVKSSRVTISLPLHPSSSARHKVWESSIDRDTREASKPLRTITSNNCSSRTIGSYSSNGAVTTPPLSKSPRRPPQQPPPHPSPSLLPSRPPLFACVLLSLVLFLAPPLASSESSRDRVDVRLVAIIPRILSIKEPMRKKISNAQVTFVRSHSLRHKGMFSARVDTSKDIKIVMNDNPREILNIFCKTVLGRSVVTILNINNPMISRSAQSNHYILELASHLGVPIISWDTQFTSSSELGQSGRSLQLAPTLDHQATAMVSLLRRYNWTSFSIVTSPVSGAADFVASLELLEAKSKNSKHSLEILSAVHIHNMDNVTEPLRDLRGTDTRVFLLHCNSKHSYDIIETATKLGMTGKEYQWILTRNCIPVGKNGPSAFPVGMLGISFAYDREAMLKFVHQGMLVWLTAIHNLGKKKELLANRNIPPDITCESKQIPYWQDGEIVYRELLNTNVTDEAELSFNQNGTLQKTKLMVLNLQWLNKPRNTKRWVQVGEWARKGLKMKDITWPGESTVPPIGRPKRGFLRVSTLHEKPYVMYRLPEQDNSCGDNGLPCWVYPRDKESKIAISNVTEKRCCVGLSMDLLKIFSQELNFDFHIKEVEDGKWGALNKDGKSWNGLVEAVLSGESDIVMTSIKINPERSTAIQFSVPYLETGIKIIVALRAGAISPTAFLEPFDIFCWILMLVVAVHLTAVIIFCFEWAVPETGEEKKSEPYDYASWALILIFSVHATGTAILIFEWLSPDGLNRGLTPMREHKFSLFRSFWLIWAMLFSTSVQTDQPKGIASRFLANIWALFALVFLASYTANLAAFMITKEEYYDLSGIQDYRLQKPKSMNPPFKYATIPNGSTEANIRANHKAMYRYMQEYNQPDVEEGIAALKEEKIQAFIYDSSVLEYYASRDDKCRLVTVGNRYAMTGYGVGFGPDPTNPWIRKINKVILRLQSNGELDRLQKFWLAGACDMKKEKGVSNRTLGILNFTSAFILLGSGVLLGLIILVFEHSYFIFGRKHLRKLDKCGCCALVSLSMGKSLQLKDCVDEAISKYTKNRCRDPVCETQIWKLRHQLDMALLKIENLSNLVRGNRRGPQLQIKSSASQDSYDEASEVHDTRPNGTRRVLACGHAVEVNRAGWRGDGPAGRGRGGGPVRLKAIQAAPEPPPRSIPESPPLPPPPPPQRQSSSLGKHMQETTFDARPGAPVAVSPEVTFKGNGNMVDKFERFLERFDREEDDLSPAPEEFDSFLPPPPFGESPLISKDTSKDSVSGEAGYALRGFHEDGSPYIGFEGLSSDGRDSNSALSGTGNAGHSGTATSSNASPMHALRRTPSYTSAVGGSLGAELADQNSPQPTPSRVRQYGGKKYMGVQNDTALS